MLQRSNLSKIPMRFRDQSLRYAPSNKGKSDRRHRDRQNHHWTRIPFASGGARWL